MLRIRVNDAAMLAELRASLEDADCSAVPVSDDTLLVTHPFAHDEHEARLELKFFLAAWQAARPGAEAELVS